MGAVKLLVHWIVGAQSPSPSSTTAMNGCRTVVAPAVTLCDRHGAAPSVGARAALLEHLLGALWLLLSDSSRSLAHMRLADCGGLAALQAVLDSSVAVPTAWQLRSRRQALLTNTNARAKQLATCALFATAHASRANRVALVKSGVLVSLLAIIRERGYGWRQRLVASQFLQYVPQQIAAANDDPALLCCSPLLLVVRLQVPWLFAHARRR